MNAKYTEKPIPNPNEAKLFGFTYVIPAQAGIQNLLLEAGSWLLEAVSQKQTQFSHDQICIIKSKTQKWRPKS